MGERGHPVVTSVVMFPGQGVQRVGMGRDVAERFPAARAVFDEIDDALGVSLTRVMWDGPEAELTLTHNAQPAILAHSLAVYEVVKDALAPVAGAGHSLGEYSAYVAAGAMVTGDAARLVRRRGELMLEAGEERPGSMAAVIGLDVAVVESVCRASSRNGDVVVPANINAPGQIVISGDPPAVERAGQELKSQGAKRVLPLNVSGAFHSPLMEPAEMGLREELARVALSDPRFPVIANASAEPVCDAPTAKRLLGEQLTRAVRWVESMQNAIAVAGPDATFVELGPGSVLSGLMRRIDRDATSVGLGTAEQLNEFLEEHG